MHDSQAVRFILQPEIFIQHRIRAAGGFHRRKVFPLLSHTPVRFSAARSFPPILISFSAVQRISGIESRDATAPFGINSTSHCLQIKEIL